MVYLQVNENTLLYTSNNLNKANSFSFFYSKVVQIKEHGVYSLCFLFRVLVLNIFYGFLEKHILIIRHFTNRYLVKEYFT